MSNQVSGHIRPNSQLNVQKLVDLAKSLNLLISCTTALTGQSEFAMYTRLAVQDYLCCSEFNQAKQKACVQSVHHLNCRVWRPIL